VGPPTTCSTLGQRDELWMYNWMFALLPNDWPRCGTSDRTGQLIIKYCQLDPRNRRHRVTTSCYSNAAGTMRRRYWSCHTKLKGVERCQQIILWPDSHPLSWRCPNWWLGPWIRSQDRAGSGHQTGCQMARTLPSYRYHPELGDISTGRTRWRRACRLVRW